MNIVRRVSVETFFLEISLVTEMLQPRNVPTIIWKLKHINFGNFLWKKCMLLGEPL